MNDYEQAEAIICRESLFEFLQSQYREYSWNWHHILIAEKIQQVIEGKIKRLMLFVPPQHQKSTIASRAGIAWALGVNPSFKIVHCAYGSDLVEGFSRDIQRIIDNSFYANVFPGTYLSNSNSRTDNHKNNYIRTVERFELVNQKGSYFCAGVGGGITGKSCDIGIIDDPIKGAAAANSKTIRDSIWEWYLQDFLTRLHNDSRQIIIQTRWHHDDLAGRLLKKEADKWEIVNIPAIKEDNTNNEDPRQIGGALYPELHSLERLLEMKERSPKTFAALYQQRPTVEGGNIIKSHWIKITETIPTGTAIFFVDTAYTEKTTNDPTGIIATIFKDGILYILKAEKFYLDFPALVAKLETWVKENGYNHGSSIRIEPKASGLSVIQYMKKNTSLNVVQTPSPKDSKETKLNVSSATIEAGKVYMVKAGWNEEFINELCLFPQSEHDEYVDVVNYAIDYYFNKPQQFKGHRAWN